MINHLKNPPSILDIDRHLLRTLFFYQETPETELNKKATLSRVCKTLHRFFQEEIRQVGIKKLFESVIHADYEIAEKIVKANPSLMFEEVRYVDGRITPLQYAFRVYDTYMWKMFLENIQHDGRFVQQFLEQALQQKEHIHLKFLFDEYKNFDERLGSYINREIPPEALDKSWLRVGLQQSNLPCHMLKQFCSQGLWGFHATFDIEADPRPSGYPIYFFGKESTVEDVSFEKLFGELGTKYTLIYSPGEKRVCAWPYGEGGSIVDSGIFKLLFKTRKNDLRLQVSRLIEQREKMDRKCHPCACQ